MKVIEDLIILGRAVPELRPRGGGTKGVCLAGFSPTHGFIRIDPCRVDLDVHRWDIIRVEVEKRPQDARQESWRIINSVKEWHKANEHVEVVGKLKNKSDRIALLESNLSPCVQNVNDAHVSLCLIKPQIIRHFEWVKNARFGKPYQTNFFSDEEEWVNTSASYEYEPRIRFTCPDCKTVAKYHDMKFIGWDAFEYHRKYPNNLDGYWRNAGFYDESFRHYFLIGNQRNILTSYIIIGVIWLKEPKVTEADLTKSDDNDNEDTFPPAEQLSLF